MNDKRPDGVDIAPDSTTVEQVAAPSRSLPRLLWDLLFGFDYFIAHRWVDGHDFATALAEELRKREFDCFLDEAHYEAGGNLHLMQRLALGRTTRLIVIVSPQSHISPTTGHDWLVSEVQEFRRGRERLRRVAVVVPIGTKESLSAACHPTSKLLPELPLPAGNHVCIFDEAAAHNGIPDPKTVAKLNVDFTELRRKRFRLRALTAVAIAMTVLALVAIWQAVVARQESQQRQALLSEASRREYVNGVALLGRQGHREAAVSLGQALRYDRTNSGAATLLQSLVAQMHRFPAPLAASDLGDKVQTAAASPDGNRMVVCFENGTVAGFAPRHGQWQQAFRYVKTYLPDDTIFSADGGTFAQNAPGGLEVRDAGTGALLVLIRRESSGSPTARLTTFALHPNERMIVGAWEDGVLELWKDGPQAWQRVATTTTGLVDPRLAWHADDVLVAGATGETGALRVLDAVTLAAKGVDVLLPARPEHLVAGPPGGGALALDAKGGAYLCQPGKGGSRLLAFRVRPGVTTRTGLSLDHRSWVIANYDCFFLVATPDGSTRNPNGIQTGGMITSMAFTPDSRRLLLATQNGQGISWDIAAGGVDRFCLVAESPMTAFFWSEELARITTVSRHGGVGLWNAGLESALPLSLTADGAAEGAVQALRFEASGALLALRAKGVVERWTPPHWHRQQIANAGVEFSQARFLADGRHLAVTTRQGGLEIREADSLKLISGTLPLAAEAAAFDASVPLDRIVVATRDRALNAYRLDGSFLWGQREGLPGASIRQVTLIPEKRWVMVTGNNFQNRPGSTQIFDLETGRQVAKELSGEGQHESHGWIAARAEILTVEKGVQNNDWVRVWHSTDGMERQHFPIPTSRGQARYWPQFDVVQVSSGAGIAEFYSLQHHYPVAFTRGFLLDVLALSPDGQILAAGNDAGNLELRQAALGSPLLPENDALNAAMAAFGGSQLTAAGTIETVPLAARVAKLREAADLLAAERTDDFTRLLRWRFAPGPKGAISPAFTRTRHEEAGRLIALGTKESATEAYDLDPTHPLVHFALAAHETVPLAEFYRGYGLRHLPADATICLQAAEMLIAQRAVVASRTAAARAARLAPKTSGDFPARLEALLKRLPAPAP